MLLEHQGKQPQIHESAYIAPTAVICGDVRIEANCRILFGAVIVGEGGTVTIGENSIIMENAVIRGTRNFPTTVGRHVLVGPHAHLTGCRVDDKVFIATGACVFNGAHIGSEATIRINGVVHIKTKLPPKAIVPIGWVAIGDPVEILPANENERISEIMTKLDFSKTVFGLNKERVRGSIMPEMTRRYAKALGTHRDDHRLD